MIVIYSSLVLLFPHSTLAIPLTESLPALLQRKNEQCSNSTYQSCGSSVPGNFCCEKTSTCNILAAGTTILCCPENGDCSHIMPLDCDIDNYNVDISPQSDVLTTATDVELPKCGNMCCPFGYSCGENKSSGQFWCTRDDDQKLSPGIAAEVDTKTGTNIEPQTTLTASVQTDVVTITSYTQGAYPTNLVSENSDIDAIGREDIDESNDSSQARRIGMIVAITVASFCAVGGFVIWAFWRKKEKCGSKGQYNGNSAGLSREYPTFESLGKPQVSPSDGSNTAVWLSSTARPMTAMTSNTDAIAEKFGIKTHDLALSAVTLPHSYHHRENVLDGNEQIGIARTKSFENSTASAKSDMKLAGLPIQDRSILSQDLNIWSPTSPVVHEVMAPAKVFRKDTTRNDRRIKVLNIMPPTPLRSTGMDNSIAELPASPVSTRFMGTIETKETNEKVKNIENCPMSSALGSLRERQKSHLIPVLQTSNTEDDVSLGYAASPGAETMVTTGDVNHSDDEQYNIHEGHGEYNPHLEISFRGREDVTPSIKTFGRGQSQSRSRSRSQAPSTSRHSMVSTAATQTDPIIKDGSIFLYKHSPVPILPPIPPINMADISPRPASSQSSQLNRQRTSIGICAKTKPKEVRKSKSYGSVTPASSKIPAQDPICCSPGPAFTIKTDAALQEGIDGWIPPILSANFASNSSNHLPAPCFGDKRMEQQHQSPINVVSHAPPPNALFISCGSDPAFITTAVKTNYPMYRVDNNDSLTNKDLNVIKQKNSMLFSHATGQPSTPIQSQAHETLWRSSQLAEMATNSTNTTLNLYPRSNPQNDHCTTATVAVAMVKHKDSKASFTSRATVSTQFSCESDRSDKSRSGIRHYGSGLPDSSTFLRRL